jgi:hypothetical protein
MANTFKISTLVQNINEGRGTNPNVQHSVPQFTKMISGYASCVLELTGTGSHTLINDATNFNYNAGTTLNDPITGAPIEITDNIVYGMAIVCARAAAGTATTGHVRVTNSGFCAWMTDGHMKMGEDSVFIFHNPASGATSDATGLTIDLSNGTGFVVSVFVWCK